MEDGALLAAAMRSFGIGLGLIVAIGAQNAFILERGLVRDNIFLLCLTCAVSDAMLIAAGVAGLGQAISQAPTLIAAVTVGGAAFLYAYAFLAARRALRASAMTVRREGRRMSLSVALATCLGLTFLNPHVYLDTVVLVGSLSAGYATNAQRAAYAGGAIAASFVWFFLLGYGARLLVPLFARQAAWRVLDAAIALIMAAIATSLLAGLYQSA